MLNNKIKLKINKKRIQIESLFQMLGKSIENFNRVCDLLAVNLRTAHEAQSLASELKLFSRYFAHMSHMDSNRAEIPLSASINIQTQRINEFKSIMQRFLVSNTSINQIIPQAPIEQTQSQQQQQ